MDYFVWSVLAMLIWGIVALLEKVGLTNVTPVTGLFYRCMGIIMGLLLSLPFMLNLNQIKTVTLKSGILFITCGFLASIVAQLAFYQGLKFGEASRVILIAGSYPVVTFILGIFILGESVNLLKVVGMVFILGGVWLLKIS